MLRLFYLFSTQKNGGHLGETADARAGTGKIQDEPGIISVWQKNTGHRLMRLPLAKLGTI